MQSLTQDGWSEARSPRQSPPFSAFDETRHRNGAGRLERRSAPQNLEQHSSASRHSEGGTQLKFLVIIEKGPNNLSAYLPDLPGCVSAGRDREEVLRNIREADEGHLEVMREYRRCDACRQYLRPSKSRSQLESKWGRCYFFPLYWFQFICSPTAISIWSASDIAVGTSSPYSRMTSRWPSAASRMFRNTSSRSRPVLTQPGMGKRPKDCLVPSR